MDLGIKDLDVIRMRAGLMPIKDVYSSVDEPMFYEILYSERALELFTEWANRWFDLNRTGRTEDILRDLKPDIDIDDLLYPIPEAERERNPSLGDQNSGY